MDSSWMDELLDDSVELGEDPLEAFYCPYTNTSVCALLTKGWQPQELCHDLECEQLKFMGHRPRRRKRAA
jgi:hypothetical protein